MTIIVAGEDKAAQAVNAALKQEEPPPQPAPAVGSQLDVYVPA